MLVNDNDGAAAANGGREGWLQLTTGIANGKRPYDFGELALLPGEDLPDAAVPDAAASAWADASIAWAADASVAARDAGARRRDAGALIDGGSAGEPVTAARCACALARRRSGVGSAGLVALAWCLARRGRPLRCCRTPRPA
jgi:hypothetical protein